MGVDLGRSFALCLGWSLGRRCSWVILGLLLMCPVRGADFVPNLFDPEGVGFNDLTPVSPVGGNPGTTLGEQRLNVLNRALAIMEASLQGNVPIIVQVIHQPLSCTSGGGAVLASASSTRRVADFPGAPRPRVLYPIALANQLAGVDLEPGPPDPNFAGGPFNDDLFIRINIGIDEDPTCLGGAGWYYGLDHNESGQPDLLAVLLHEVTHGLGFSSSVDSQGNLLMDIPDIYTFFIFDLQVQKSWPEMDRIERLASRTNDPDVVWTGPQVAERVADILAEQGVLRVSAPAQVAGDFTAQNASFGPLARGGGGLIVPIDDGTMMTGGMAGTVNDGCEPFVNADDVRGNIALIERGACTFVSKTLNAQTAGAQAVLIYNNVAQGRPPMGGISNAVFIPALGIEQSVGLNLRAAASPMGKLDLDDGNLAGTGGGQLRLHAPSPFQPGSSISHWTTAAFPNLSMEPSINGSLTDDLDLTLALFRDLGWTTVDRRPRIGPLTGAGRLRPPQ